MADYYESKLIYDRRIEDWYNLKKNPLWFNFNKNKKEEGYYLGVYFGDYPKENSVHIESLQCLANAIRSHSNFFSSEKITRKRMDFIEGMLS